MDPFYSSPSTRQKTRNNMGYDFSNVKHLKMSDDKESEPLSPELKGDQVHKHSNMLTDVCLTPTFGLSPRTKQHHMMEEGVGVDISWDDDQSEIKPDYYPTSTSQWVRQNKKKLLFGFGVFAFLGVVTSSTKKIQAHHKAKALEESMRVAAAKSSKAAHTAKAAKASLTLAGLDFTMAPTVSNSPTVSAAPTNAPTVSPAPTVSSAPTNAPTVSPAPSDASTSVVNVTTVVNVTKEFEIEESETQDGFETTGTEEEVEETVETTEEEEEETAEMEEEEEEEVEETVETTEEEVKETEEDAEEVEETVDASEKEEEEIVETTEEEEEAEETVDSTEEEEEEEAEETVDTTEEEEEVEVEETVDTTEEEEEEEEVEETVDTTEEEEEEEAEETVDTTEEEEEEEVEETVDTTEEEEEEEETDENKCLRDGEQCQNMRACTNNCCHGEQGAGGGWFKCPNGNNKFFCGDYSILGSSLC